MAKENGPLMSDFLVTTSIYEGFSSQPCLMKPEGNRDIVEMSAETDSPSLGWLILSNLPATTEQSSFDLHLSFVPRR